MRATRQPLDPFFWLLPLLVAWALLAAPLAGQKTASGQNSWLETASSEMTGWKAAPRLGFQPAAENNVSGDSVVAKGAGAAEKGGLNLFKWGKETTTTPGGWKEGDFMLHLPDKGSTQANWAQNSGRLREQMGHGNPIYDSYRDALTGQQIPTKGFLGAERNLLESRGWQYNSSTGAYRPPSP